MYYKNKNSSSGYGNAAGGLFICEKSFWKQRKKGVMNEPLLGKGHEMCISDRSLYVSAGSVSDLCISVCKWYPGDREDRSAEVPAGNKVEAVK